MPIINGKEVLNVTANQLDELLGYLKVGQIDFTKLTTTTVKLFSNESVPPLETIRNVVGIPTGNCVKLQVTFSQMGSSTNCTMNLMRSDHEDLSNPSILETLTLGTNQDPAPFSVDLQWIPPYTFVELINNDPDNPATCTIDVTIWKAITP